MEAYEHRQWAPLSIVVMLLIIALITSAGMRPAVDTVGIAIILMSIGFARLTTRVDRTGVSWSFTFGIPGGHIAFADLERAEPVTTNIFEGWGIHWTIWHGWLWNVWGFRAVELFLRNGRRVTLGTDDPQGLAAAIQRLR